MASNPLPMRASVDLRLHRRGFGYASIKEDAGPHEMERPPRHASGTIMHPQAVDLPKNCSLNDNVRCYSDTFMPLTQAPT